jgi:hypothetical protein
MPVRGKARRRSSAGPDGRIDAINLFNHGTARPARIYLTQSRRTIMPTDTPETAVEASPASWIAEYQDHNRRLAEARPANKDVLFDALTRAGITRVHIEFDGYGDSGQIESINIRAGDSEAELPDDRIEFLKPMLGYPDRIERLSYTVTEAIESLVYALLEETHGGWENNDGAFGDFTFDVEKRTVTLDYNDRYTDSEHFYHEF